MNTQSTLSSELSIQDYLRQLGRQAREASRELMRTSDQQKSAALVTLADLINENKAFLLTENAKDLENAKENNLDAPLLDRLTLTDKYLDIMQTGLRQIAAMPNPVGSLSATAVRPNGMKVAQMRVPIGVIGIIYESRPNVTVDAAALCLKSGNACILRGGSEAFYSNQAFAKLISESLEANGLHKHAVQVIETTDRAAVGELIRLTEFVDVIIPRGGKSLLARLADEARVPMIMHLDGNCHMYIDEFANEDMAIEMAFHAKTHRYGICGSLETLLVHKDLADKVLAKLGKRFLEHGDEMRVCPETKAILEAAGLQSTNKTAIKDATEEDWETEFLAPIIAIRLVESIDEAIAHITQYGSGHTESIITDNIERAEQFQLWVDSSSVYVNLPTIFADGFEYGLGAEIGISTNRLHARGPVGLEGLTTYKWVLNGHGQKRG
ncbi:MAG: glutamate-5-semialdehyde dehydrogenase [Alcaligenaceae bacterium]|jgi:glutamate-5-semialdehyde dehydrogenase|nr:glutamate-5-semialdehyde dehydrogenase [Alcaligenaceae bacterium]